MKGYELRLVLKLRHKRTWKWPNSGLTAGFCCIFFFSGFVLRIWWYIKTNLHFITLSLLRSYSGSLINKQIPLAGSESVRQFLFRLLSTFSLMFLRDYVWECRETILCWLLMRLNGSGSIDTWTGEQSLIQLGPLSYKLSYNLNINQQQYLASGIAFWRNVTG